MKQIRSIRLSLAKVLKTGFRSKLTQGVAVMEQVTRACHQLANKGISPLFSAILTSFFALLNKYALQKVAKIPEKIMENPKYP